MYKPHKLITSAKISDRISKGTVWMGAEKLSRSVEIGTRSVTLTAVTVAAIWRLSSTGAIDAVARLWPQSRQDSVQKAPSLPASPNLMVSPSSFEGTSMACRVVLGH